MVEQDTCVRVSDESLTDARRVRDLLSGVIGLLKREMDAPTADAARATALEARAATELLIDRLEQFFAWQREQERNVHAQAGKHISRPSDSVTAFAKRMADIDKSKVSQ